MCLCHASNTTYKNPGKQYQSTKQSACYSLEQSYTWTCSTCTSHSVRKKRKSLIYKALSQQYTLYYNIEYWLVEAWIFHQILHSLSSTPYSCIKDIGSNPLWLPTVLENFILKKGCIFNLLYWSMKQHRCSI